jgi:hypothetical protein
MFRLADETTLERVEGSLLRARDFQTMVSAWWWNTIGILFIVISMGAFLYARISTPKDDTKQITFEPQLWYSASRNINSDQYQTQRTPLENTGIPLFGGNEHAPV